MSAFIDARTVPEGTILQPDLAIVGGGPAGISMALALANTPLRVALLESGGMSFDAKTQALYDGAEAGAPYLTLQASRLRCLGGGTNIWGGWCRPMDNIDFEERSWMPYSGWPFGRTALEPYYPRAQTLCEAGPWLYEKAEIWPQAEQPTIALGQGGVVTRWFQFSKMRNSDLPTHFGDRYAEDLKRVPRLSTYLHANVTRLGLAPNGGTINELDVATLSGRHFKVKPKCTVLAMGAVEIARLMLASNDVMPSGVGNAQDLVGRYFADHPIPRDIGTLVLFDGKLAPFYMNNQLIHSAIMRAGLFPSEKYRRAKAVLDSSITIESETKLDDLGKAALAATAAALGVDSSNAVAFSLGGGCEVTPDPDRRFTLDSGRDALGMPKLKLQMRLSDSDLAHFRETLKELGRQLLVSRVGMLRLNRKERSEWLDGIDWGNHHMGTTRAHSDPRKGVVDANLQVHGIANLFVVGSAVYPTYGAVNPTMSLLALALRLADHLKGQLR
ncbi:MAG: GMC family oxidoreductase [Rhizomicrobium sp.]